MNSDGEPPAPQLVPAIERVTHLIDLYLERETATLGITQAEAHILARLGRSGPSSPSELHRLLGHKRSTLTSVLDRLDGRGYVTREVNPADRRSFAISLTEEGRSAAAIVVSALEAVERRVAGGRPRAELESFASVLGDLERELTSEPQRGEA
ncbi:MAG: MarR family winged helix-turn-helix transcriptional regulator [Gaiellaceae bacterium]